MTAVSIISVDNVTVSVHFSDIAIILIGSTSVSLPGESRYHYSSDK